MQKKFMIHAIALVLSGMVAAGAANAADQKSSPVTETVVNVQGVQVAIDPSTGRLVAPTDAQRAALSKAMVDRAAAQAPAVRGVGAVPRNETEALTTKRTVQLKNGHTVVGYAVPENLMSTLVAERNPDGSLSIHHAGDTNQVKAVEVTK